MILRCDGKIIYFVVAESLGVTQVTLFDLLEPKDTVLDAYSARADYGHGRKISDSFLHKYIRWFLFMRGLRLRLKKKKLLARDNTRNSVQIRHKHDGMKCLL